MPTITLSDLLASLLNLQEFDCKLTEPNEDRCCFGTALKLAAAQTMVELRNFTADPL